MLSREEKKNINTEFFKELRDYLSYFKSSNGKTINWLTYPTDVKQIFVRLHVDSHIAALYVDIQAKDDGIRAIVYEQLGELQRVMEENVGSDAIWIENHNMENGQDISRIKWVLENVSIYNPEDKIKIFEFWKEKLLGFDIFYQEYKEILILLTK